MTHTNSSIMFYYILVSKAIKIIMPIDSYILPSDDKYRLFHIVYISFWKQSKAAPWLMSLSWIIIQSPRLFWSWLARESRHRSHVGFRVISYPRWIVLLRCWWLVFFVACNNVNDLIVTNKSNTLYLSVW